MTVVVALRVIVTASFEAEPVTVIRSFAPASPSAVTAVVPNVIVGPLLICAVPAVALTVIKSCAAEPSKMAELGVPAREMASSPLKLTVPTVGRVIVEPETVVAAPAVLYVSASPVADDSPPLTLNVTPLAGVTVSVSSPARALTVIVSMLVKPSDRRPVEAMLVLVAVIVSFIVVPV